MPDMASHVLLIHLLEYQLLGYCYGNRVVAFVGAPIKGLWRDYSGVFYQCVAGVALHHLLL